MPLWGRENASFCNICNLIADKKNCMKMSCGRHIVCHTCLASTSVQPQVNICILCFPPDPDNEVSVIMDTPRSGNRNRAPTPVALEDYDDLDGLNSSIDELLNPTSKEFVINSRVNINKHEQSPKSPRDSQPDPGPGPTSHKQQSFMVHKLDPSSGKTVRYFPYKPKTSHEPTAKFHESFKDEVVFNNTTLDTTKRHPDTRHVLNCLQTLNDDNRSLGDLPSVAQNVAGNSSNDSFDCEIHAPTVIFNYRKNKASTLPSTALWQPAPSFSDTEDMESESQTVDVSDNCFLPPSQVTGYDDTEEYMDIDDSSSDATGITTVTRHTLVSEADSYSRDPVPRPDPTLGGLTGHGANQAFGSTPAPLGVDQALQTGIEGLEEERCTSPCKARQNRVTSWVDNIHMERKGYEDEDEDDEEEEEEEDIECPQFSDDDNALFGDKATYSESEEDDFWKC